ncbi:PadR family transcriptional regulator [Microbacterium sp. M3]|uniref:PadR family transcriptional regulator n=1 Tax=Microbacterium arthrosphaerae TaxID=792652 RepID=A0ABU4GX14_9MICO|nr:MULTISPECIES: PadR family transcriptional regulator [Microbacterium]MDW4571599.1 PadR family transcriptional regulator [Microbacterium arthrosphaerae]MDW7605454.1 PadR family transcriptional regulator [Microbacterium sp. M3]
MSGSFTGDPFGPRHRGQGAGIPGSLWDAMDQLRDAFEQKFSPRMARGDVRAAVLAILAEKPMHGYQIIQEIETRSDGAWKPSPGSVYPTLQMLADEGLIVAEESGGKKTYSLTEAGRAEAGAEGARSAPWESFGAKDSGRVSDLPKAGAKLAQAAAQVGRGGTPEQVRQAVDVLDEARRKLYSILAQD